MQSINLDQSELFFPQDEEIEFIPEGHRYLYRGTTELIPVSTFYSQFFPTFESEKIAARKAATMGIAPEKLIEEWNVKRDMASSVGTFMHKQIENILGGGSAETDYEFTYQGKYANVSQRFDISKELCHFRSFLSQLTSVPLRTEWCVFDIQRGIAGTIDFICRNDDGTFEIFDWKRSNKVDPDGRAWDYGLGPLSHIPNTAYWHYVLQQNIYRRIVEDNYGIHIRHCHLVVLHPDNSNYIIHTIPWLDAEVSAIYSTLK